MSRGGLYAESRRRQFRAEAFAVRLEHVGVDARGDGGGGVPREPRGFGECESGVERVGDERVSEVVRGDVPDVRGRGRRLDGS